MSRNSVIRSWNSRKCHARAILACVSCLVTLSAASDTPTLPCGTFTFNGAEIDPDNDVGVGINAEVRFEFEPAICSAICTCDLVEYVQIVRIFSQEDKLFVGTDSEHADRIVPDQDDEMLSGWAVDRWPQKRWGYYGREALDEDSKPVVDSLLLRTGSNERAAILRDGPRMRDHDWFEAVSVPVCVDAAASCNNRLLGYYYWSFEVGVGTVIEGPLDAVAETWVKAAFDLAVDEWNNKVAGPHDPPLMKEVFPAMSPLP